MFLHKQKNKKLKPDIPVVCHATKSGSLLPPDRLPHDKIVKSDEIIDDDIDCILVLGCQVLESGQPSHMLRDRLLRGIELYELGVVIKKTTFGNEVRCYNAERTICDLIRSRSRMDEETVISAIKNYAVYKDKDLNRLASYAEKFRVSKILKQYMEVLL